MSKSNKIAADVLTKAAEAQMKEETTYVWNGIEITITPTISMRDTLTFVDGVTKMCFSDENEYMPEVKDFAIRGYIVKMYTNLTLTDDIEKQYAILCGSDIVDFVLQHINNEQLKEIVRSANDKIANHAQANIEMINKQVESVINAFESLYANLEKMFNGISQDDISNMVKAIGDGHIDEEKIVNAFLEKSKSASISPTPQNDTGVNS